MLARYPPVEELAGAKISLVDGQRMSVARIIDGVLQLTGDGQFLWESEFRNR